MPQEIKSYLKANPLGPYTEQYPVQGPSEMFKGEPNYTGIPSSLEEVITVVSTGKPTVAKLEINNKDRMMGKQKTRNFQSKLSKNKISKSFEKLNSEFNLRKPIFASPVIIKHDTNSSDIIAGEIIEIRKYECSSESDVDIEEGDYNAIHQNGTILLPKMPQPQHHNSGIMTSLVPVMNDISKCSGTFMKSRYMEMKTKRLKAVYKLSKPTEEIQIDPNVITDEEKIIHPEFFDYPRHPKKLKERYLKIRGHIIEKWEENKPNYITKTAGRRGLKNCGDVNLIGRVHAYLEQIGAINFGCEQCRYNNPHQLLSSDEEKKMDKPNLKVNQESTMLLPPINSLIVNGTRKRKKKIWSDPYQKDLLPPDVDGGYTMEHDESGAVTVTHVWAKGPDEHSSSGEEEYQVGKSNKRNKKKKQPIELVPLEKFTLDFPAPYSIEVELGPLLTAMVHSHTSPEKEVMGLLGGRVYEEGLLRIQATTPCMASTASDVHCEMCPVSQSEGAERLELMGLRVVGWYHSHPKGVGCEPSQQDIASQSTLQYYFGERLPFSALIFSPSKQPNPYKFFTLNKLDGLQRPFELSCRVSSIGFEMNPVLKAITDVIEKSDTSPSSISQCIQDVDTILISAKPELELNMVKVFSSKLESIFTEDRITEGETQSNFAQERNWI